MTYIIKKYSIIRDTYCIGWKIPIYHLSHIVLSTLSYVNQLFTTITSFMQSTILFNVFEILVIWYTIILPITKQYISTFSKLFTMKQIKRSASYKFSSIIYNILV